MEKIIVAIRTLNDNLKIVATRVEDLEKRVDAIAARVDGIGGSLTDSIHNLSAQTETRLAELTERVYALENTTPAIVDGGDDIGDALDDILGGVASPTTVVEETPTAPTVEETVVEAPTAPTAVDDAETALDALLGGLDVPTVAAPTVAAPTPKPTKTPAKTKAVVASAVQRRAYARQYMVEHGAKVEDLRSPAKIEEVMQTEEFKTWAASR